MEEAFYIAFQINPQLFHMFDGKFTKIATGSNSTIYTFENDSKKVVLKIVPSHLTKEAAHLQNQFKMLQKVHHANFIKPFRFCTNIQTPGNSSNSLRIQSNVLVMEYATNGSLFDLVKENAKSYSQKKKLFLQLAQAIDHLHSINIAHRDIKLENVLVTDANGKPTIKVSDLGFAGPSQNNGETILSKEFKGTVKSYMAPQIFRAYQNKQAYPILPTDVFALGVVLFSMMVKKKPFEYGHMKDVIYRSVGRGKFSQFWEMHSKEIKKLQSELQSLNLDVEAQIQGFKGLFQSMVTYDTQERVSMPEVLQDRWFNDINI